MTAGRSEKGIHFKIPEAELKAFKDFASHYPRMGQGNLIRMAICDLVRRNGFDYPDIPELDSKNLAVPKRLRPPQKKS